MTIVSVEFSSYTEGQVLQKAYVKLYFRCLSSANHADHDSVGTKAHALTSSTSSKNLRTIQLNGKVVEVGRFRGNGMGIYASFHSMRYSKDISWQFSFVRSTIPLARNGIVHKESSCSWDV